MNRSARLLKSHSATQHHPGEALSDDIVAAANGTRPASTEVYRGENPVVE